jgi:hypothetical protein
MAERLYGAHLAGTPSFTSSPAPRGASDVFAGVAIVASGTSGVTVSGVNVTSDCAIFLGSMVNCYTVVASGFTSRALTVCSLTSNVTSSNGTTVAGAFNIVTMDGLAVNSAAQVKVPWLIWRAQ